MKKILSFLIIPLCLLAASCNNGNEDNGKTPDLEIVSQNLSFTAAGGDGTVVVKSSSAVTATSNTTWCTVSVSGTTVTVNTLSNESLVSRTAEVKIISGETTLSLAAHQEGSRITVERSTVALGWREANHGANLGYFSPLGITSVDKDASWLTYEIIDDKTIYFEAEVNRGPARTATVTLHSGKGHTPVTITQAAGGLCYEELLGTWTLSYIEYGGTIPVKKQVTFEEKVAGSSYSVGPIPTPDNVNYFVTFKYDQDKFVLTLTLGENLGAYGTSHYLLTGIVNYSVSLFTVGTAYSFWANLSADRTNPSFAFNSTNTSWTNTAEAFIFWGYLNSTGAGAGRAAYFKDMTFTKNEPVIILP